MIRKGVLKSFDSSAYTASVRIVGSLSVWLDDVKVSQALAAVDMVAGRSVAVLFLDPSNPDDAVVIGLWGAVSKALTGGFYGINLETLTGAKTLTPGTDEIYQYLDEGGANRIITLATTGATAGDRFVIRHNGAYDDTHYLQVKQAATTLDTIYAGGIKEFIFDGTNWISRGIGTGENDNKINNLSIGVAADGYDYGTAVGKSTRAREKGVAVGHSAYGQTYSVGIGYTASASSYNVAVGSQAGAYLKSYSIALGYNSWCTRYGETSINIDGTSDQENNVVQGRWAGETANNTPLEIFCGGVVNERFTIRASSALAFRMTIVARDNVAGHVAMYTVGDGLIKRDASNNTAMALAATITTVHEDDAAWDVAVTADDTNEALIVTVTGDGTNPTQWAVVMDGVETHF